jgi:hypothetical protein
MKLVMKSIVRQMATIVGSISTKTNVQIHSTPAKLIDWLSPAGKLTEAEIRLRCIFGKLIPCNRQGLMHNSPIPLLSHKDIDIRPVHYLTPFFSVLASSYDYLILNGELTLVQEKIRNKEVSQLLHDLKFLLKIAGNGRANPSSTYILSEFQKDKINRSRAFTNVKAEQIFLGQGTDKEFIVPEKNCQQILTEWNHSEMPAGAMDQYRRQALLYLIQFERLPDIISEIRAKVLPIEN